ncbi:hypothetical protein [Streptomyces pristinaespiralis]|uniref:hypothetical protein n=1 Tax=Streptomyces pristinaespiralis TaxID=38300 RepID=UPI003838C38C
MKYRDLVRKIRDAAAEHDLGFHDTGQGKGSHEKWVCGQTPVIIPGHREINEITAENICKRLEAELGKGWWRR